MENNPFSSVMEIIEADLNPEDFMFLIKYRIDRKRESGISTYQEKLVLKLIREILNGNKQNILLSS